jgi:ABC-type nitrate/sulfonate/bicarbonate transport system substrate-binding protein
MSTRDQGVNLVNIAQVFGKSGLTLITWKDTGINTVAKMKGKNVANWLGGNEYEVFAALAKYGMDPLHNKGVTIVPAALLDGLLPQAAGLGRLGDDLQRARAGARGEEPEDRQALPS